VAAVALAEGLIFADQQLGDSDLGALDFLITMVGESGSRDLLGAIAGSMLTVASTTFSITIAVLALSSSTYGPRLVRNFMADRGNQLVLGIFVDDVLVQPGGSAVHSRDRHRPGRLFRPTPGSERGSAARSAVNRCAGVLHSSHQ
jgi:hypothetical protein